MTENNGNDYFDTEKLIVEMESIFWDTHLRVSLHIFYEAGPSGVFG
jgi:hypothetical protein